MPAVPDPVVGQLGAFWSGVFAAIRGNANQTSALTAGSIAGIIPDPNGNTFEVYGPNLLQTAVIGAKHGTPGVQVLTNLGSAAAPVSGRAIQSQVSSSPTPSQVGCVTTTVTLTQGSTAATLASGTGFVNGMVIGAANVTDPSNGTATPAIVPGTTISSGGGTTSITLSQAAAESGSGLYCAACFFVLVT